MNSYVINAAAAVIAMAAFFLIRLLNAKIGNENLIKYYKWARIAVNAVEQIMGAGNGPDKKAEVIKYLADKFSNKISPDDIDKFIEAAVNEMNYVLKDFNLADSETAPEKGTEDNL